MKIKARKRRKGQRRRGPKYWIVAMGTMGMLVAFTVGNSHAIALGRAPLGRDVAVQGQKESRFDILRALLKRF